MRLLNHRHVAASGDIKLGVANPRASLQRYGVGAFALLIALPDHISELEAVVLDPRGFALIYVAGFVLVRVLSRVATHRGRGPRERGAIVVDRLDVREGLFMGLFVAGALILPLMALGPWLPQFAYALRHSVSWIGVGIMACASLLHWRAHADLGRNYSATVRVHETQTLVTDGVYAWIRHPIYASLWLIVIAQPLLVHHWIYGLSGIPTFALLYFHRLRREEGMMIGVFGDAYRDYMQRVGRVTPKTTARGRLPE